MSTPCAVRHRPRPPGASAVRCRRLSVGAGICRASSREHSTGRSCPLPAAAARSTSCASRWSRHCSEDYARHVEGSGIATRPSGSPIRRGRWSHPSLPAPRGRQMAAPDRTAVQVAHGEASPSASPAGAAAASCGGRVRSRRSPGRRRWDAPAWRCCCSPVPLRCWRSGRSAISGRRAGLARGRARARARPRRPGGCISRRRRAGHVVAQTRRTRRARLLVADAGRGDPGAAPVARPASGRAGADRLGRLALQRRRSRRRPDAGPQRARSARPCGHSEQWFFRGSSAVAMRALDVLAATIWSAALVSAATTLNGGLPAHAIQPGPRGAVLGAVLGGVLAVGARALRGPV